MLNVTELREKFHAARLKDATVADFARKYLPAMFHEIERLQYELDDELKKRAC